MEPSVDPHLLPRVSQDSSSTELEAETPVVDTANHYLFSQNGNTVMVNTLIVGHQNTKPPTSTQPDTTPTATSTDRVAKTEPNPSGKVEQNPRKVVSGCLLKLAKTESTVIKDHPYLEL